MRISSPAFSDGELIPRDFTGDGGDRSPPLVWSEVPARAHSLALICEDPDAPSKTDFTHWVVFDIPSSTVELPEGLSAHAVRRTFGLQGMNDFGSLGYRGPSPPAGHEHRYVFTLYAVDRVLDLPAGATKDQVLMALAGHEMERAVLTGRYQRVEQPAMS
jgi:Raf kinase inhibitor-like YbhB/YbcL family protein